jgi:hypothetical protein
MITELKKQLGHTLAELRKMETSLALKREALKNMDRVYFGKLGNRENEEIAARKQAEEEEGSVGLALWEVLRGPVEVERHKMTS